MLCTFLAFQAESKSNWILTHHHKVKFASEYLKLTENIFDMKTQKATVQPPNPSVSLGITVSSSFPLMEGVWQALEKKGLDSNSCHTISNNLMSLSLGLSIWC